MRIVLGTIFLLLLYSNGAFAESRQTPTQAQNGLRNKIDTSNQYKPTNESSKAAPFKVQIVPPSKDDPERYAYNAEQCQKATMELWTIRTTVGTAIILFLQLCAFCWQGWHLKRSVDTAIAAERPYLLVETKWKRENRQNDEPPHNIRCVIKNFGKTPGIITYFDCKLLWDDGHAVDYGLRQPGKLQANGPMESGENITLCPVGTPPEKQIWDGKLICYGKIHYNSIFKKTFVTEFHHVFESALIGFRESENQERNRRT
jgi:hypothetical protein